MVFKFNIGEKGKTWKLESDSEDIIGKKIGEKVTGKEIKPELEGYEFEITGTSDKAGFPGFKEVEGETLKGVLLGYGKGMHKRPKGLSKKPNKKPAGLRLKKTVRGNTISKDIVQINLKIIKSGSKKLEEMFPEQNKPKAVAETPKPAETAEAPAA